MSLDPTAPARPPTRHRARALALGTSLPISGVGAGDPFALPPDHLVTHGVVVGMTGSGKTGLLMVTVEEALRSGIPVLMVDVKGDLPNLALAFPTFDAAPFDAWPSDSDATPAEELAAARARGLTESGLTAQDAQSFHDHVALRIFTPGDHAGEPLHLLSALERRSSLWDTDPESARTALASAVSLVLRLLDRDPDPAASRDHVLLSVLAERHLREGRGAALQHLLHDLECPPVDTVGEMALDDFVPPRERHELAASLNALLASPSFAAWRTGASLDVGAWMTPAAEGARTPAVIVSVAHLDDLERTMVLGVLLDAVLAWVRTLQGTHRLRALVVFDEVYGFLPPHPANPPTKRPLVALMKQARAFGVGVIVATQNPMDLDYRALGNAGLWCVGRLQTDADRARLVEALAGPSPTRRSARTSSRALDDLLSQLSPRWFLVRDAQASADLQLLRPRFALSWLRGPMTRAEIRRLRASASSDEPG